MIFPEENNNFKLDISGFSNKNDFPICKIKISDLIFEVAVKK
jgi:hypothetical protein